MDFSGNPYIGVYAAANDDLLIVSREVPPRDAKLMAEALGVELVTTMIMGTTVVGSLIAMNSRGIVVSGLVESEELVPLRQRKVVRLGHRLNAVGNNILCNDSGAVVHPGFDSDALTEIREGLGVRVERGMVAGIRTVGSAAIATNKGALCHPHTRREEADFLKEILGVPVTTTTANYGTAQVGACMVANSRGAIVGSRTTPIEMGRIEEGLGYL